MYITKKDYKTIIRDLYIFVKANQRDDIQRDK